MADARLLNPKAPEAAAARRLGRDFREIQTEADRMTTHSIRAAQKRRALFR